MILSTPLLFPFAATALAAAPAMPSAPGANVAFAQVRRSGPETTGRAASRPVAARFFVTRSKPSGDIRVVRRNTEAQVSIAGRYSQAVVSCGIGCNSFWIVDRRTGAVIDIPPGSNSESVYDVKGSNASATISVTYGPSDGTATACRSQAFVISGETLRKMGQSIRTKC